MKKKFNFERLSVSDCNMILKKVHPDMNPSPEARELTEEVIKARAKLKASRGKCGECYKPFAKYRVRGEWRGKFCSIQCSSIYDQKTKRRRALSGSSEVSDSL